MLNLYDLNKRIASLVRSVGENFSVSVKVADGGASTDGKTVNVPDPMSISKGMGVNMDEAESITLSTSLHEAAHVLMTDFTFAGPYIKKKATEGFDVKKLFTLLNVLEDVRIDHAIAEMRKGIPHMTEGSKHAMGRATRDRLYHGLHAGKRPGPEELIALAFVEVDGVVNTDKLHEYLTEEEVNTLDSILRAMTQARDTVTATKNIAPIAEELYHVLFPETEEEGEGESGTGEENEDEEEGDGEGEGSPSDDGEDTDGEDDAEGASGDSDAPPKGGEATGDESKETKGPSKKEITKMVEEALKGGRKDLKDEMGKKVKMSESREFTDSVDKMVDNLIKSYPKLKRIHPEVDKELASKHAIHKNVQTLGLDDKAVLKENFEYVTKNKRTVDYKLQYKTLEQYISLLDKEAKPLITAIKDTLRNKKEQDKFGKRSGKVASHLLYKTGVSDNRVFNKTQEDVGGWAVSILLDLSGSTRSEFPDNIRRGTDAVWSVARCAADLHILTGYLLSKAFHACGIKCRVVTFTTVNDIIPYEVTLKDWEDAPGPEMLTPLFGTDTYSIFHNNRDGWHVRTAGRRLLARPEQNKVLFVMSDGIPSSSGMYTSTSEYIILSYGSAGAPDVTSAVNTLRSKGIDVCCFFSGPSHSHDRMIRMYGKDFVAPTQADSVPSQMVNYIKRRMSK